MRGARALGWVLVVASAWLPRSALADEPRCAVADRECGRDAFARGTADFDKGRYQEALAWFTAAESATAHPIIAFNLALCHARLGKVTRARVLLGALVSGAAIEHDLRDRAKRELAAVEARLARVSVESPGSLPNAVELDGERLESTSGESMVDPGPHRLRVLSEGVSVFDQDVDLAPGEHLRIRVTDRSRTIDVVVVPDAAAKQAVQGAQEAGASGGVSVQRRETPTPTVSRSGLHPAWFCAAGAVTVLWGVGAIASGVDVQNAYHRYEDDLSGLTQQQADARVADGHSRELRTNLLLGGTALSAAGTALLGLFWTDWQLGTPRKDAAKVVVAPAWAGVAGTF